jgi:hypothetical protein
MRGSSVKDSFKPRGKVEILVTRRPPVLLFGNPIGESFGRLIFDSCNVSYHRDQFVSSEVCENIIVNQGKNRIIESLVTGNVTPIGRMCIGDNGTIPSDATVPKVPLETFTSLYKEIFRADVEGQVLTVTPTEHKVQFIKTFSAVGIPLAAYSNQSKPVVNEVGLVMYRPADGPLPRNPVISPASPPQDEILFSIRTFKTVPFEAANEIAVTIRYTVFID